MAIQIDFVRADDLIARSVPAALAKRTVAPKKTSVAARPPLGACGSTTSAASIRFVRNPIRRSIWRSRRLPVPDSRRFHAAIAVASAAQATTCVTAGRSLLSKKPVLVFLTAATRSG